MSASDASAVLTILGAGTLVPDAARASAAHHIRTERARVLLDCGAGTVHGFPRHGVSWEDLTHVVISHWHNDHIGDLPALLFAFRHGLREPRAEPLTLIGPVGLRGLLDRLAAALGGHVLDPGLELRVVELESRGRFEDPSRDLSVGCVETPHTPESLAYRVEGSWGVLGYTGDTGPSDEVADFVAGTDALVAECNHPDEVAPDTHLTPASLAALAVRARPGLLVVVHVGPFHTPEAAATGVGARYAGRLVAAVDGLRVRIGQGGAYVDPPSAPM